MPIDFKGLSVENLGGLQVLVYGDTGVGKTTFAASAYRHPDLRRVGILDTDVGLTSISHWSDPGLTFASVEKSADIQEVAIGAISNKPPFDEYRTWVVDSLSKWVTEDMRDISEREYSRAPGKRGHVDAVQIQDYKEMTARISRLSDGLKSTKRNVIFTAAVADIGMTADNPNAFTERRPHMPNAIWKDIAYKMDCIWYIFRRPDGTINMLTRSVVLPNGATIQAKTRNTRFAQALMLASVTGDDGKPSGIVQIGHQDEPESGNYLDFARIYDLYINSVKGA